MKWKKKLALETEYSSIFTLEMTFSLGILYVYHVQLDWLRDLFNSRTAVLLDNNDDLWAC